MSDLRPSRAEFDLRVLRYFVAVAEHRHFRRAAVALQLTQPSLSRHIQRLEDHLGVRLLDRTPQGASLTAAGIVFLPRAQALLRSAAAAATAARAAARPSSIRVGYSCNLIITAVVRDVRYRYPDAEISTLHLGWDDQRAALLDHRVDTAVVRMPFPNDGLDLTVLYEEPRALMMSISHRLAGKDAVTLADIADESLVRHPYPAFNAFWRIDPRPDGRPAPDGPVVAGPQDELELIASGDATAIVPESFRYAVSRQDVTWVSVVDIEPCQVVLATRRGEHSELLTAVRTAAQHNLASWSTTFGTAGPG